MKIKGKKVRQKIGERRQKRKSVAGNVSVTEFRRVAAATSLPMKCCVLSI